jgi:hypothetical protein
MSVQVTVATTNRIPENTVATSLILLTLRTLGKENTQSLNPYWYLAS